ncbi:MAG: hypothetical protein LBS30_05040, partial [Planctomycetota bacterium]|nr:hypothetical protein [Planctomycetota bacterium]
MSRNAPNIASIGVDVFDAALRESGAAFTRLDWKPPAGGDTGLVELLFRIDTECLDDQGESLVDQANR